MCSSVLEYLYRSAFELGRHLIGSEIQKALAGVDWFKKQKDSSAVGVIGYGEGGMLAMYAAAIDSRIDAACVSGYFDSRQALWRQPIDPTRTEEPTVGKEGRSRWAPFSSAKGRGRSHAVAKHWGGYAFGHCLE